MSDRCEDRHHNPERQCMRRANHNGPHRYWAWGKDTADDLVWGGPPFQAEPLKLVKEPHIHASDGSCDCHYRHLKVPCVSCGHPAGGHWDSRDRRAGEGRCWHCECACSEFVEASRG
jgi:hypothetical protein